MSSKPSKHKTPPHEQKWFRRFMSDGAYSFWRIESEDGTHIANVPISQNKRIDSAAIAARIGSDGELETFHHDTP